MLQAGLGSVSLSVSRRSPARPAASHTHPQGRSCEEAITATALGEVNELRLSAQSSTAAGWTPATDASVMPIITSASGARQATAVIANAERSPMAATGRIGGRSLDQSAQSGCRRGCRGVVKSHIFTLIRQRRRRLPRSCS